MSYIRDTTHLDQEVVVRRRHDLQPRNKSETIRILLMVNKASYQTVLTMSDGGVGVRPGLAVEVEKVRPEWDQVRCAWGPQALPRARHCDVVSHL